MKKTLYIISVLVFVLFAAACESKIQPDEEFDGESAVCFMPMLSDASTVMPDSNAVMPDTDPASRTKAADLVSADGSISLALGYEVCEGIAGQARNDGDRHAELDSASDSASPETKGTQLNTTGSDAALGNYSIASFKVAAWKGSSNLVPANTVVTKGTNVWTTSTPYSWDASQDATFYAYANLPSSGSVVLCTSSANQTLIYTALPTAATAQNDILLGFYKGKGRYDEILHKGGIADVMFYHPLTSVQFKLKPGAIDGATTVSVKKISISKVYAGGTAEMTPPATGSTVPAITWTPLSSAGTTTVTLGDGTSDLTVDSSKDYLIGEPFILIPQALTTSPVTVTVDFSIDGTPTTLAAKINTGEWKAGKTNIYTLGYDSTNYSFSLSPSSTITSTTKTYNSKTTDYSQETIQITSLKEKNSTSEDWGWEIKSYQIGSGTSVDVAESATEFTAGGLVVKEVTSSGKKALSVQAKKWVAETPGSNEYWTNEGGVSGDTEGTGWSPKSWAGSTIDLSKLDYTEKTAYSESNPMRTANCYIIRHAGTYKFPLVYGNAIDFTKNSTTGFNTQAYNPTNTTNSHSTNFLAPFKNHRNEDITSPFIENNSSCAAADGTSGAAVLWSDYSDVITGVKVIGDTQTNYNAGNVRYIEFTVSETSIRQNNAVIAVKNASTGDVMWSWHIWTTNDPTLLDPAISVTNHSVKQYSFFPLYNLGWIDGSTYVERKDVLITLVQKASGKTITINVTQPKTLTDAASNGVHYQWGRKDPMPAKEGTVSGFNVQSISSDYNRKTLGTAIQNANIFYLYYGNWCSTLYLNLWTGTLCKTADEITSNSDTTTKTVYDPSPVGYKVPSIFAFSGFTTTGNNVGSDQTDTNLSHINVPSGSSFSYGWNFNRDGSGGTSSGTIFFPASGWRENNPSNSKAGQLYLATDGNYHSAFIHATNNTDMTYFAFKNTNCLVRNTQKHTLGCSVRPVTE